MNLQEYEKFARDVLKECRGDTITICPHTSLRYLYFQLQWGSKDSPEGWKEIKGHMDWQEDYGMLGNKRRLENLFKEMRATKKSFLAGKMSMDHKLTEQLRLDNPNRVVHELKTVTDAFNAVWEGMKSYEIRKDDRGYGLDQTLVLREIQAITSHLQDGYTGKELVYDPPVYTGRIILGLTTYISRGVWGLPPDLCVMAIRIIGKFEH